MARIFIFLVVLLTGCSVPVSSEGDEMAFKQYEWGQTRKIQPAEWQRDRPLSVVNKDPEFGDGYRGEKRPFVKNLTLGTTFDPATMTGTFALRWLITFGVGGGQEVFEIDASSLQQMSFSADLLRVALVSRYPGIVNAQGEPLGNTFGYSNPGQIIEASAFFAEGLTATDSPTLTQKFNIDSMVGVSVPIPKFVSSFRILGNPSTSNPFDADVVYSLQDVTGASIDVYTGDEIFGIRLAPVPTGEAVNLFIFNGDLVNGAIGSIEWELDL